MSEVLPVGTNVVVDIPEHVLGVCYSLPDQTDVEVYKVENPSLSRGVIFGCFPAGFVNFGLNPTINAVFEPLIQELKRIHSDNWQGFMFYLVVSNENRYLILPSGYVRRDDGLYN